VGEMVGKGVVCEDGGKLGFGGGVLPGFLKGDRRRGG